MSVVVDTGLSSRAVIGRFYRRLEEYAQSAWWTRLAMHFASSQESETYRWLGMVPQVREWVGGRRIKPLRSQGVTIVNKTWEATIRVDADEQRRDKTGQIMVRINELARRVATHPNKLLTTLLSGGEAAACYDGQYFFDTDHSEGDSGTQSNKGTSALDASALQVAITAMMKYKDDKGKLLGIVPDLLVVPPDLQWTAMELLESTYWPGSQANHKMANNVLKGKLDLLVSPYLTDTTDWFVFSTKGIIKPMILQSRAPVEFAALEGDSESGFMRDQYIYGVRARYNVGYGLWQMAYASQVA